MIYPYILFPAVTHFVVLLEVGVTYPEHHGMLLPTNVHQRLHHSMPSDFRFVCGRVY